MRTWKLRFNSRRRQRKSVDLRCRIHQRKASRHQPGRANPLTNFRFRQPSRSHCLPARGHLGNVKVQRDSNVTGICRSFRQFGQCFWCREMAVKSSGEVVRRSGLNNAAQEKTANPVVPANGEAAKGTTSLEGGSARMSILILLSTFLSAAFVMYLVYRNFPELDEEEQKTIVIPKDMDDAKALGKVLSKYKDTYYVQVLVAYFTTYIFLQTFAIPGSIFLSILSGFLYPFPLALFLVCLCSGLGASFCYMLSYLVGRPIVYKYLTERATKWSQQVDKHREHLINYIIFLRITPFLPNWFINITSPVINVPLGVFFIGTFLGVAPPSFVAIKAGTTLYQLTTAGEAVSWNSVFVLMILAIVSLLPVFFQKKLKQKFS
ncbi:hypothetical protein chiPu_0001323 [Chiloscyllium punctatum]|uniref:Transmembrane protein 41B n=2 Tax=Chiloscyllium punctatum TaxID=137246 RepID=A0A401RXS1_CHIPU|nr:hypothetical protein [Chiloscyllium punctatum]